MYTITAAVPAKFKADFGLFRPFRSSVDITRYGRYGPIMAESAWFGVNRAELVRIREKKKLRRGTDTRATSSGCVGFGCGILPTTFMLSRTKLRYNTVCTIS